MSRNSRQRDTPVAFRETKLNPIIPIVCKKPLGDLMRDEAAHPAMLHSIPSLQTSITLQDTTKLEEVRKGDLGLLIGDRKQVPAPSTPETARRFVTDDEGLKLAHVLGSIGVNAPPGAYPLHAGASIEVIDISRVDDLVPHPRDVVPEL